jgi:hypothetical protein
VKAKLTKRTVEAIAPCATNQLIWDTDIKGFGCKITPKGKRVYFLYYRTADNYERRPAVGAHGAITCEQARLKAQRWLGEVAAGRDPSEEKQKQRKFTTLQELCTQFMTEHGQRRLKPLSVVTYQGIIDNHIVPLGGKLKIDRVTQTDVERIMRSVEDGHTSRVVRLGKLAWVVRRSSLCYADLSFLRYLAQIDLGNSERAVKAKLTKRTVEAITPGATNQLIWDTDIKGFGCKITPKGKRVYFLYYRTSDNYERR